MQRGEAGVGLAAPRKNNTSAVVRILLAAALFFRRWIAFFKRTRRSEGKCPCGIWRLALWAAAAICVVRGISCESRGEGFTLEKYGVETVRKGMSVPLFGPICKRGR